VLEDRLASAIQLTFGGPGSILDLQDLLNSATPELTISYLCTLDTFTSFAPRWRPPFVSALEPSDRCHLKGLGMVDVRPKFLTAPGETDVPARRAASARHSRAGRTNASPARRRCS
jgi:hypothetical protein